jgi:hypothetical protein
MGEELHYGLDGSPFDKFFLSTRSHL